MGTSSFGFRKVYVVFAGSCLVCLVRLGVLVCRKRAATGPNAARFAGLAPLGVST